MAKSSTTLKVGDNLPSRGKSNKTLILEMMREESKLGLNKDSTKEDATKAFFKVIADSAFDVEDPNRGMCLKLLADKGWSSMKPTNEVVSFDFDINGTPLSQAMQIMKAISTGDIPPDIANTLIQSIKAVIDIEEHTDLKARIEKLEAMLKGE